MLQSNNRPFCSQAQAYFNDLSGHFTILEDFGPPQTSVLAFLALAWIIIFTLSAWGIHFIGYALALCVAIPVSAFAILFIRSITLPGSKAALTSVFNNFNGLMMWDEWINLFSVLYPSIYPIKGHSSLWKSAFRHVFFSFGTGMGLANTLASYDEVRHIRSTFIHALAIVLISHLLEFFIGIVTICFTGFLARQDQKLENVISSGLGKMSDFFLPKVNVTTYRFGFWDHAGCPG